MVAHRPAIPGWKQVLKLLYPNLPVNGQVVASLVSTNAAAYEEVIKKVEEAFVFWRNASGSNFAMGLSLRLYGIDMCAERK